MLSTPEIVCIHPSSSIPLLGAASCLLPASNRNSIMCEIGVYSTHPLQQPREEDWFSRGIKRSLHQNGSFETHHRRCKVCCKTTAVPQAWLHVTMADEWNDDLPFAVAHTPVKRVSSNIHLNCRWQGILFVLYMRI